MLEFELRGVFVCYGHYKDVFCMSECLKDFFCTLIKDQCFFKKEILNRECLKRL